MSAVSHEFFDPREDDPQYHDWQKRRRQGVGASEVAAALGLGGYKSTYRLWAEKCGLIERETAGEHAYWGRKLEPLVAYEFEQRTRYVVNAIPEYELQQHPDIPFLYASPDRELEDDETESLGTLECKVADVWQMRAWDQGPPLEYQIQGQVQLACTGWAWGYFAALIAKQYRHVRFERVDAFIEQMLKGVERFWRHVETRTEPPLDGSFSTRSALKELYPEDSGETIEFWPTGLEWLQKWEQAKADEKDAKARRQEAENHLLHMIGEATWAEIPQDHGGGRLQYKLEKRKGYEKKMEPWQGRILRRLKK